ncbi:MAG TPA: peptidylprolyl isomerase [Saprospiraceae bacterium]|nr:peptidylprolyl isomerase [Saprospiraceae bacterium]
MTWTARCKRKDNTWCLVPLLVFLVCIAGCKSSRSGEKEEPEIILAEVYDQKLTLSDVRPLLIDPVSTEDSASQIINHVESWVREALLLHEAEQNAPVDVNINKLVQDYRASLLISTYENMLVKSLLDTVVTEAELKSYYERNKDQYQLEVPILRCHFVKLKKPVTEKELFQRLWKSKRPDDMTALVRFSQTNATDYLLQDSIWYRQPDIERLLPTPALTGQNLYAGRVIRLGDNEYEYHLRIMQRMMTKEIAPLSYVSEQARRYILHKRKIDLLEKIKADIYAREIDGVNVKIHI